MYLKKYIHLQLNVNRSLTMNENRKCSNIGCLAQALHGTETSRHSKGIHFISLTDMCQGVHTIEKAHAAAMERGRPPLICSIPFAIR